MRNIAIHFDGACHNNAKLNCPMGLGVAVFIDTIYREDLSRAIGIENHHNDGTSNIAEWLALCEALKIAVDLRRDFKDEQVKITIFGDSQLICNQFNLIWRINEEKFKEYFTLARQLNATARVGEILWVKRELNTQADELSKIGLQQIVRKRYHIKGRHDDSDSEWIEYQSDYLEKVEITWSKLMSQNKPNFGQIYSIVDTETDQEIHFNKDK